MKLTFRINKPIDLVFDYLTDMQKFTSVHPVIHQIDHRGNENYTIHEKLKFGFIPFPFKYTAMVHKDDIKKSVSFHARIMKLIKVKMDFNLTADNDHTLVEENIQFKSILPIKFIMKRVFMKQHKILFENIEKR